MDNKTNIKLEAPPSDDDSSNEEALFMNEATSVNEFEAANIIYIKVEASVSDVNLQNERQCFPKSVERDVKSDTTISNYDFEIDSKISIKEELVAELPNVEYLDCTNDRDIETITKTEQSEAPSVPDISQVNKNKESNGEENEIAEELPSSESPRSTTEEDYHYGSLYTFVDASDFKTASGKNDGKEISMRPNICNSVHDTECSESAENVDDELLSKCKICEKYFSSQQALKRHSLWHSQQKPYKCEHCAKCFTKKSNLKAHAMVHLGTKPYKCEHCEKCFTQKAHLKAHALIHSGTKPYKCEHCETYFTQKSNLKAHILVHSGTKPYQCDSCEKCFTQKSDLNRHALLHTGLKPYKCKHCERCFTQKSSLNRHTLFRHKTKQM